MPQEDVLSATAARTAQPYKSRHQEIAASEPTKRLSGVRLLRLTERSPIIPFAEVGAKRAVTIVCLLRRSQVWFDHCAALGGGISRGSR